MGEVWKACDTRLERIVAMKFPNRNSANVSSGKQRRSRGSTSPEYAEGAPLKGLLPLDQRLNYPVQIASSFSHNLRRSSLSYEISTAGPRLLFKRWNRTRFTKYSLRRSGWAGLCVSNRNTDAASSPRSLNLRATSQAKTPDAH